MEEHHVAVLTNCQESVAADYNDDGSKAIDHGKTGGGSGRIGGGGGSRIVDRRAATCGFKAERISTPRFRASTTPLRSPSPSSGSPYLTIPPGISPTALLGSPIMLPNDQVSSSFNFIQRSELDYHLDTPLEFEIHTKFIKEATSRSSAADPATEVKVLNNIVNSNCDLGFHPLEFASDQTVMQKEPFQGQDVSTHISEGDQKGTNSTMGIARTSEDGYNWRKYGQKQVKGSEYPRSYYKCTHPNCQVKKKVECSLDGQITEIIYKGAHNHPKPQPCRRPSVGSTLSSDGMPESAEEGGTCVKVEDDLICRNVKAGSKDIKLGSDWRARLERTSSTSVVTELSELSTAQGKSVGAFESAGTPEFSSTRASHGDDVDVDDDDNDYRAAQGSISLCDDAANDDESESKRSRKTESCFTEMNVTSGALREPRVVVQIESEVDILDDGYRWRKYGQKVVKGNPNPRSYYKCTSPGCPVRKHVERASHDLKCVLTTYDGKHNHEIPAARSSSHVNSSGNLPATMPNTQAALALSRNTNALKSETPAQDIEPPFDRKLECKNEYMGTVFLGDLNNEMKLGEASLASVYQMKFPSIQKALPYGSFGQNPNYIGTYSSGSFASTVPSFPISSLLSFPTSANLSMAGFRINNGGKSTGPTNPFPPGLQLKQNSAKFQGIKQELKDDNLYDPCPPIFDHESASSPIYQLANGSFPS